MRWRKTRSGLELDSFGIALMLVAQKEQTMSKAIRFDFERGGMNWVGCWTAEGDVVVRREGEADWEKESYDYPETIEEAQELALVLADELLDE